MNATLAPPISDRDPLAAIAPIAAPTSGLLKNLTIAGCFGIALMLRQAICLLLHHLKFWDVPA